jgi:hypothetical protein
VILIPVYLLHARRQSTNKPLIVEIPYNPNDVQKKINEIILERYPHEYAGRVNMTMRKLHMEMREKMGDEKFLEFLEEQQLNNPVPVYQMPESIKELIKSYNLEP